MKTTFLFTLCLVSATLTMAQVTVVAPGACGNGIKEADEACDPGFPDLGIDPDLGGATCEDQGFTGGGELVCTSRCSLDFSLCFCDAGALLPSTGQTKCWDVDGNLIDCAGTAHDGDIRAGAPLSYTDNGDGTITDDNTRLMWEKKNDSGGIHDVDDTYAWDTTSGALPGFALFIDKLNNTCDGDGFVQCDDDNTCGASGQCGFAGHRDWRVPNVKELVSILDYGGEAPNVHPVFHSECVPGCVECSCTVDSISTPGGGCYWSATSVVGLEVDAHCVRFVGGVALINCKVDPAPVRAVRGGL